MLDEKGQDLVEYALVIASLAFAATAGMSQLANGINSSFSSVAGLLTIA
jgi:pilus assembly protein Flp/PilA